MIYTDLLKLFSDIKSHKCEFNIIRYDQPREMTYGFICQNCECTFEIKLMKTKTYMDLLKNKDYKMYFKIYKYFSGFIDYELKNLIDDFYTESEYKLIKVLL